MHQLGNIFDIVAALIYDDYINVRCLVGGGLTTHAVAKPGNSSDLPA